jgi:outer membrane scaffolding protein for murein synthesis (MipA/OmpV family)
LVGATLLACRGALAQAEGAADAGAPAGSQPARWGLAVGFIAGVGPEHAGARRTDVDVEPGLAVRWGRVSLASHSVFALRGEGAAAQGGLRLELLRSPRWRSSLGLRWDSGRDDGASPGLEGAGGVRSTLRARWSAGYRFDGGWRAGAALTTDALGRGGGWEGQVDAGRDIRLTPATVVGAGLAVRFAGQRWQQARFGVTPAQSALSGYPAYAPGAGLRDLAFLAGGRTDLGAGWVLFYGASVSRLAGPSAASPRVLERDGIGLSAGIVKRIAAP